MQPKKFKLPIKFSSTKILIKGTATPGMVPETLEFRELAVNTTDGILFVGTGDGHAIRFFAEMEP